MSWSLPGVSRTLALGLSVAAAVLFPALTWAHGTASRDHAQRGHLSGVLMVCCDAHGSTPEPGIVVVKNGPAQRRRIRVPHSGQFSTALPPGRYHVVGGIPSLGWKVGRCVVNGSAQTWVHVQRGRRTRVRVVCQGQ